MLYISTGAFKDSYIEEILAKAETFNLFKLELASGAKDRADNLSAYLQPYGQQAFSFMLHNYFPVPKHKPFVLNLAAIEAEVQQRSIRHCREAIKLASEVGSPYYSLHAGYCSNIKPEQLGAQLDLTNFADKHQALDIFCKNMAELADYAETLNVKLAVENNVVAPFNLVNGENRLLLGASAQDMTDIMSGINRDNVSLLLDVAHLKVSANALGFCQHDAFDAVADKISILHLSDNDGFSDTNQPIADDAWFWPHINALKNSPHMVLEVYNLSEQEILSQCQLIESNVNWMGC